MRTFNDISCSKTNEKEIKCINIYKWRPIFSIK